ncbi:MAG: DUF1572 domain-containing protein [Bacteroidota bacterium]|nr:DUF1572 domain-containing protein [Bacteroidota bacterium]
MQIAQQIARHIREVYFGGNWTSVNYKEVLAEVGPQQATRKLGSLNTIAVLVFHTNYYVSAITQVLKGEPLTAKDKYSFDLPPITTPEEWTLLLSKSWRDAEELATLVEQLPDEQLGNTFADEKYGSFYRNLHGLIEHCHYHLGQIVLIKKLLAETT